MSLDKLAFTKNWTNPADFPTYQGDETKVRADMQELHDQVRDYLNHDLLPKLDTTIDAVSNQNLLDNWYFLAPVNQRGQTSYSKANKVYTIDRWQGMNSISGIEVTESGIKLNLVSGYNMIRQFIEAPERLLGKTVTLTALFSDGTLEKNVIIIPDEFIASTELNKSGVARLQISNSNNSNVLYVKLTSNKEVTIAAVKLELGSDQTLAHQNENGNWVLNEIPNYGEELAKCQRYFLNLCAPLTSSNSFPLISVFDSAADPPGRSSNKRSNSPSRLPTIAASTADIAPNKTM